MLLLVLSLRVLHCVVFVQLTLACLVTVNACDAGPGNLDIAITSRGISVHRVARQFGTTGLIEVWYTPICFDPHIISVRFNGESVNGTFIPLPGNTVLSRLCSVLLFSDMLLTQAFY